MSSTTSTTRTNVPPPAGRSWPLGVVALAAAALAGAAGLLGSRLVTLWPDVLTTVLRRPSATVFDIDVLVAAPVLALGAVLASWWSLSLLLIAVSLAAERAGLRSTALLRCIHAVAPRTLRRLAVTGLGAGLTFSALPAQATEAPPDLGWTTTQSASPPQTTDASPDHPGPLASTPPTRMPPGPTAAAPADAPDAGTVHETAGGDMTEPLEPMRTAPPSGTTIGPAGAPPLGLIDPTSLGAPAPLAGATNLFGTAPQSAAPATPPPALAAPPPPVPAGDLGTGGPDLSAGVVVVAAGDTLWDLAAAGLPSDATDEQVTTSWHAWYALNAAVIGDDPDLLLPGQLLQVPSPS